MGRQASGGITCRDSRPSTACRDGRLCRQRILADPSKRSIRS